MTAKDYVKASQEHIEYQAYEQALSAIDEAIKLKPRKSNFWHRKGLIHFTLGEQDQAISAFSQAIELRPENTIFYTHRGTAHCMLDQNEEGFALLSKSARTRSRPMKKSLSNTKKITCRFGVEILCQSKEGKPSLAGQTRLFLTQSWCNRSSEMA